MRMYMIFSLRRQPAKAAPSTGSASLVTVSSLPEGLTPAVPRRAVTMFQAFTMLHADSAMFHKVRFSRAARAATPPETSCGCRYG